MLTSVGKQSGECVESVLKKKRKAAVGRICRKESKSYEARPVLLIITISVA